MSTLSQNLLPNTDTIDPDIMKSKDDKAKEKDAYYYNWRHSPELLPELQVGDKVRVRTGHQSTWEQLGTIYSSHTPKTPRLHSICIGDKVI